MTYAIDTTNEKGTRRWHFRTRLPSNYSAPVVEGDRVYIAAGNQLFCLSARTGRERWNYATVSDISCSPAIKDGVAYFTTRDSQFFAVGDRGKLKWKAKLDFPCYSAPSIAKDILYLGTNKGLVYAFDIKEAMDKSDVALSERKGKAPEILPKWKYRVQPAAGQLVTPDIVATPVVSGNALFVLPDDGTLNCLTAEAPDVDPPAISYQYPAKNSTVNGAPPLLLSAVLQDEGSGLNESTIAMYLDKDTAEVGELGGEGELEYSYDPIKGIVYFRTSAPGPGQPARPLKNGRHTITIEAADWKGNLLTTSWTFNVDNSLRPVAPSSDMNNGPMGGGMPGGMIGGMPH
jgi:outer membrane protein assembly factor BamB